MLFTDNSPMSTCHSPLRPKPTQELSTEDEENSIREPWTVIKLCSITKSCLTLWDPIDYSPPGSSVHDILQARTLEWVFMPSSRGSSRPMDRSLVSCISCIGRRIVYHYATWEALTQNYSSDEDNAAGTFKRKSLQGPCV